MDKTEFMERLRKAAALQAEKKKAQQEQFKALIEKLKAKERNRLSNGCRPMIRLFRSGKCRISASFGAVCMAILAVNKH